MFYHRLESIGEPFQSSDSQKMYTKGWDITSFTLQFLYHKAMKILCLSFRSILLSTFLENRTLSLFIPYPYVMPNHLESQSVDDSKPMISQPRFTAPGITYYDAVVYHSPVSGKTRYKNLVRKALGP